MAGGAPTAWPTRPSAEQSGRPASSTRSSGATRCRPSPRVFRPPSRRCASGISLADTTSSPRRSPHDLHDAAAAGAIPSTANAADRRSTKRALRVAPTSSRSLSAARVRSLRSSTRLHCDALPRSLRTASTARMQFPQVLQQPPDSLTISAGTGAAGDAPLAAALPVLGLRQDGGRLRRSRPCRCTSKSTCRSGCRMFTMVGLPDASVRESRDRVRAPSATAASSFPSERVTVNLAPADVRKAGAAFDLPIALGILAAPGVVERRAIDDVVLLGELSLDGAIQPARGVLPIAAAAQTRGAARRSCCRRRTRPRPRSCGPPGSGPSRRSPKPCGC